MQRTPAGARRVRAVRAVVLHAPIGRRAVAAPSRVPIAARNRARAAKIASGSTSRPMSRAMSASLGIVSTSATKAGSSASSAEHRRERRHQAFILARRAPGADRRHVVDQQRVRQRLHRLPAIERIAVVRGEEFEILGRSRST